MITAMNRICIGDTNSDEALLRRTINAYDAIAGEYAQRFVNIDLIEHREAFTDLIASGSRLVLDAGCGPGRDCELLRRDGFNVVGLDRSNGLLHEAKRNTSVPLILGDVRELPFSDSTFSGVWSCASLVHLPPEQARRAVIEFYRVLEPGGAVFLSVREGHGIERRAESNGQVRWFHLYTSSTVAKLLSDAGFDIVFAETSAGRVGGSWVNVHARRVDLVGEPRASAGSVSRGGA